MFVRQFTEINRRSLQLGMPAVRTPRECKTSELLYGPDGYPKHRHVAELKEKLNQAQRLGVKPDARP